MKSNAIYYIVKKTPISFEHNLPKNIVDYINDKRGENNKDSLYAWNLLQKLTKVDLKSVTFLESGKPILKGLNFSISHSYNYVAIAFTKSNANIGIDLEKIRDKNLGFLSKLSNKFSNKDTATSFRLWTEHESTIKALNLNVFKDFNNNFKGLSKAINTIDGEYSLSIYNDSNLKIEELTYED